MHRLFLYISTGLAIAGLVFVSCEKPQTDENEDPKEEPAPDPTPDPTPDPEPDPTPDPQPDPAPVADLLDLVFQEDGTAKDVSAAANNVQSLASTALMTYSNPYYNRFAAHFSHTPGASVSAGYYRVDFTDKMAAGLADGHSLEVLFSANFLSTGDAEYKMFSAMDSGGTGWLISKTARGNSLTFLPYVGGSYRWAASGILPEPGRYYHAVGVWDKVEGKAKVYVDGELKNSVEAVGEFTQPANANAKWWSIGGDASKTTSTNSWNGDVVIARVYDKALTKEEVEALYAKVKTDQSAATRIEVSDVVYLPYCNAVPGASFTIYGTGFQAGDAIMLGDKAIEGSVSTDCITITLPDDLASKSYSLLVKRGTSILPIGKVTFSVVSSLSGFQPSKVVAHRGYYKSSNLPQNSIASLTAAQQLGVWGSEFDIWMTTDGRVVVNHDSTFPTDSQNRTIQNCTFAQLSDIRLSNGEEIPTLESFLAQGARNKNVKLVCEVKTHDSLDKTKACVICAVDLVKKADMVDQVVWIAFDHDACLTVKQLLPSAHVQYLCSSEAKILTPSKIAAEGLDGIDYKDALMTTRLSWFADCVNAGIASNVWTIDSTNDMLTYFGAGANYVTTNYPEVALDLFGRKYITAPAK